MDKGLVVREIISKTILAHVILKKQANYKRNKNG